MNRTMSHVPDRDSQQHERQSSPRSSSLAHLTDYVPRLSAPAIIGLAAGAILIGGLIWMAPEIRRYINIESM